MQCYERFFQGAQRTLQNCKVGFLLASSRVSMTLAKRWIGLFRLWINNVAVCWFWKHPKFLLWKQIRIKWFGTNPGTCCQARFLISCREFKLPIQIHLQVTPLTSYSARELLSLAINQLHAWPLFIITHIPNKIDPLEQSNCSATWSLPAEW